MNTKSLFLAKIATDCVNQHENVTFDVIRHADIRRENFPERSDENGPDVELG